MYKLIAAGTILGALMLGGGTSHALISNPGNCVNVPGGALCTPAAVSGAYAAVPGAYAYAAVPNGFDYQPGTVFLPGAVAHNGEIIGRDPDPNVRLNLMKDPEPMNQGGE